MIDACGWFSDARPVVSPNANERPPGAIPSLIVIHNISLPPGDFGGRAVEDFFRNTLNPEEHSYYRRIAELKVSAHLWIRRCGELVQFVSLHRRAWHAGHSSFEGRARCNDFSIGLELEGCDEVPYSDAQYQTLIRCCARLLDEYPLITPSRIAGHSDIAPGRKTDPGKAFDWSRLRSGLLQFTG